MAGLQECKTAAEVTALARAVNARRQASKAIPPKPSPRPATLPVRELVVLTAHPTPSWKCEPPRRTPEPRPEPLALHLRPFPLSQIIKAVCRTYKINENGILSACRTNKFVRPRHVAMYLAKTLTCQSLPSIGLRFGGRDHTTVINAVRSITEKRLTDPKLHAELLALELELNPPPSDDPNQMPLPFAGEGVS